MFYTKGRLAIYLFNSCDRNIRRTYLVFPMINVATGGYCRTRDGRDGTCTYYMGIYGCVPN